MPFDEFLNHCFMQGGNWAKMLMTGIKNLFPEYFEEMEDRTYTFEELCNILVNDLGIKIKED